MNNKRKRLMTSALILMLSMILGLQAITLVGAESCPPGDAGEGTSADNPLAISYILVGNLDVIVVAVPFSYATDPSGTFTVSGIPSGSTVVKALVYHQEWEFSAGETASSTLAGNSLGTISPFTHDPGGAGGEDLAIYRWDVTSIVTGDGSYSFTTTGLERVFVAALVVVYSNPANPSREVRINDGAENMHLTTATTTFSGVASGSGKLIICTEADNDGFGETGETIAFNGVTVGGPVDANLGNYASLFTIPVTTVSGTNTASITTTSDWFGWHLAILLSPHYGVDKVKVIPAPVQFWREFIGGVTDIIVSDPPDWPDAVALVRDYAVLHKTEELPEGYIPLELLTWEGTQQLPGGATWEPIDTPEDPYILSPGEVAEYDIITDPAASAVLVRYTVAWASSQDVIEAHFVNEAILESESPQVIVGQLSNFDVHNDYHEPVDNFELELYGIQPSDIIDWFPGWGAPPQINPISGGTEIIWMDPAQPVQPCEWVHFGLHLKPGVIATGVKAYWTQLVPARTIDKKVYVELLKNGDFSSGLDCWSVRVEKLHEVRTYDGPTWLAIRPLPPGWTDIKLINEPGRTNVLDIVQTVSDGDGDWTGAIQTLNRDVSGFSELYFEADGKAMFQSLAGDGWVGGEYPVHFVITYTDVNGVDHDAHVGYPPNPAWQQGFYYLAGNLPNEPYSNLVTQNVWFHYKSPNLMNLSPAPRTIKTVRLYSSGWAYQGRIDNAQLYGTPPSAELGDVIHVQIEVTVPSGETVTVVDTLPHGLSYIGPFTVDGVPATPTITKIGPPPPIYHEISYTITESGTYLIEFDCKVDTAYWEDREVCNVVTATWYDEAGEVVETKEDAECFIIHAFEELHKSVGIPKKVKVIPAPVQFWREFIGGVTDIIVFDPPEITEPVALVRDYVVLHEGQDPIPLEHLTWSETENLPWERIDFEPYILPPDGVAEYDIPTVETDTAVLVRYTVAWASTPDVIECEFINEAILERRSPQVIVGQLSNFDVHNDYHEPVDNFELELYGIQPSDIVDWFPGWGAPPQINAISGGTEIIWMDPAQPVQPCEWVHFGLHLKPGVIATGIKAYWTQLDGGLVIKEKTNVQWRLEIELTNPFCYTMKNVTITDRFGAEIEIDPPFPYSITHGTVSYYTQGNSEKVFLTWDIGDLLPGETARLIILVSTDINPARGDCNKDGKVDMEDIFLLVSNFGSDTCPYADIDENGLVDMLDLLTTNNNFGKCEKQEYTEPGIYELNSGATLKFIDPLQDKQLSAVTDSIYVTVLPEEDP